MPNDFPWMPSTWIDPTCQPNDAPGSITIIRAASIGRWLFMFFNS